jgi:hypothetical protein
MLGNQDGALAMAAGILPVDHYHPRCLLSELASAVRLNLPGGLD